MKSGIFHGFPFHFWDTSHFPQAAPLRAASRAPCRWPPPYSAPSPQQPPRRPRFGNRDACRLREPHGHGVVGLVFWGVVEIAMVDLMFLLCRKTYRSICDLRPTLRKISIFNKSSKPPVLCFSRFFPTATRGSVLSRQSVGLAPEPRS